MYKLISVSHVTKYSVNKCHKYSDLHNFKPNGPCLWTPGAD